MDVDPSPLARRGARLMIGSLRCLLAVLVAAAAGCGIEEDDSAAVPEEDRPDRIVMDFELTETREGRLDWRLTADEARYFKEEGQTRLAGVRVEFFAPDGSLDSRLTAYRGLVTEGTGDMLAEGNVVLVSADGDTLLTEELRYLKAQDLITGDKPVRVAEEDRVLKGVGFKAKPDLSDYHIERDVEMVVVDRSGGSSDEP